MQVSRSNAAVHWCWILAQLDEEQIFNGIFAGHKPGISLFCPATLGCEASILPESMLLCTGVAPLHSCMKSRSS